MSLKDIKAKIKSTERTRKVTKAMETVSAVKMRKSQIRATSGRPYASAALSVLKRLSASLKSLNHPLTDTREIKRAAIIVVTSDKGLCGVLNSSVLRATDEILKTLNLAKESIDIYAYGKKAAEYYERRGYSLQSRSENISDDVSIEALQDVVAKVTQAYSSRAVDVVHIVHTNFKSTFEQFPVTEQVLPLSINTLEKMVDDILPTRGFTPVRVKEEKAPEYYTIEPSPETVLETLIPKLASVIVYHALLESKASEHSARMVAMKNASDKSKELSRTLTRTFNKARQASITREVSEIVGGIEAMAV